MRNRSQLECGTMPNVMAAQPNIGGALCESSVILFLVPCCKVWLTPLLECRAVTLPYGRTQDSDAKSILHVAKFRYGTRAPENVYIVYQLRRRPNIVQSLVGLR